jgi:tetrapyrrole methylase family protein/MazG family protein
MAQDTPSVTPARRELRTFGGLRKLISTLRGPDGCPWDRAQTHESLRTYLLEESSETLAALDEGDRDRLREELGDLLLQIALHVQIAEESGEFTLGDVLEGIGGKLLRRHPHVFGEAVAETPEAVVEQWDELKRQERGDESALSGIPATLPALSQAQAIQRRAAGAGFTWDSVEGAWEALDEELEELRQARTAEERREEAGDAIFAMANVARWLEIDAEEAVRSTCRGFSRLFRRLEGMARERGLDLRQTGAAEKLALWEEAKEGRE